MSTFRPDGSLDPEIGRILTFLGAKRSGKSVMALMFFRAYPGDKLVLDLAYDDGPVGPDVITLQGTKEDGSLATKWPEHLRRYDDNGRPLPMTLRYVPQYGDGRTHKMVMDDLDAMLGMVVERPEPTGLLIHEVSRIAPASGPPPNMVRLLNHNRHNGATTMFMCGPRSQQIDPLVVSQADLLYVFKMPNVRDRQRIAQNIDWDANEFHAAVMGLGPHEYLRYDVNEDRENYKLLQFPALPKSIVDSTERWADGYRPGKEKEDVL